MTIQSFKLHLWWRIFAVIIFTGFECYGLNLDGVLLLSFKYSVVSDPLGKLANWSVLDETPCAWNGVSCAPLNMSKPPFRVIGLTLPNSQIVGSIPANLGMIQNLKTLDLSNNTINGSIPLSIFLASELQILDISNNKVSGELPELISGLKSLQILNLSDNALSGKIPENLTSLHNLTSVSLKNNYFSGNLPGGFDYVQVLDLSSNLINGSLPANFGGSNISYFNVSFNKLSGEIPPEFFSSIPLNASLDLSFNNISGEIPEKSVLLNQDSKSFAGNTELCGRPLKKLCPIPSTMSSPPNASEPTSPPAIAAIPKTIDSSPADTSGSADESSVQESSSGLKPIIIVAIVVANVAVLTFFVLVFICIYQFKRKKNIEGNIKKEAESAKEFDWGSSSKSSEAEHNWLRTWTCLKKPRHGDAEEETSSESSNTESEENEEMHKTHLNQVPQEKKNGELVTIDGEKELELETLLKASAYILGASGSSIMYKAVLEDGMALAVRRIGESGVERFKDFENQVRVIAKLVHPNLVKIRGFYWGADEKLVIYDYVPNGSLANARYRKAGTSPCHLPWEIRLKIATGVARGLSYIHDKKHVHGNLKPSNILLGLDMEPKIGDFGLERLVTGENSSKASIGSARYFGSKRSTASRESFHDFGFGPTPSPSPSAFAVSHYYAPESLRSIKPNPKWDVFSFGVVLLELLTGKIIVSDDMGPGLAIGDFEEKGRVLRMADVAIRADLEGKEDAFLALLKIGYSCISPVPQRRPSMKEVLHALDKFPTSSSYLGH